MFDDLLSLVHQTVTSPWLYAVVAGLAALDMFFPVVPGETAVITAGVAAATGPPYLLLVIVAAALGAFAGDHVAYSLGRGAEQPLIRHLHARPASRRARAFAWARTQLARRGGRVLIASRCLPGVRTATTVTMGLLGYRLRSFTRVDALAAPLWATGSALIGFTGGALFPDRPLLGLLIGLGLAAAVVVLAELAHRVRTRNTTTP